MNLIEKHGNKIATALCVASFAPIGITILANETNGVFQVSGSVEPAAAGAASEMQPTSYFTTSETAKQEKSDAVAVASADVPFETYAATAQTPIVSSVAAAQPVREETPAVAQTQSAQQSALSKEASAPVVEETSAVEDESTASKEAAALEDTVVPAEETTAKDSLIPAVVLPEEAEIAQPKVLSSVDEPLSKSDASDELAEDVTSLPAPVVDETEWSVEEEPETQPAAQVTPLEQEEVNVLPAVTQEENLPETEEPVVQETTPVQDLSVEPEAEPAQEQAVEEPEAEPAQEQAMEKPTAQPAQEQVIEEPKEQTSVETSAPVIEVEDVQADPEPEFDPVQETAQPEPAEEWNAPAPDESQQSGLNQNLSDLNARIASEAKKLIGVTDGWQCTEVATEALINAGIDADVLWPEEYARYGEYTDNPVAGNLVVYEDGGLGMSHIAVYVGDGQAVHGNFLNDQGESVTVQASVNLGNSTPQYIQVMPY